MQRNLMMSRKFAPLFWTQFLSAFNDNFLKNTLIFVIMAQLAAEGAALVTLAGGIFIARHLWGMTGAIAAVAVTTFAAWPLAIWFKVRQHVFTWRAEALLVPAIVGGLACGWVLRQVIEWAAPGRFLG